MSTVMFVVLVVLVWLMLGLGSALLFLGRRGYRNPAWYFLGAALGPLFVPIAWERGRGGATRTLKRTASSAGPATGGQLTVLVGVDGSAESDQAVRDAARLFAPAHPRIVLVAVADPDLAEFDDDARRLELHHLLTTRASWLPAKGPSPLLEVLCGQPDLVLLEAAATEKADAVVIGRRGRGLSHRLLGSVAQSLSRRAPVPVLLARPTPPHRGSTASEHRVAVDGHSGAGS